MRNVAGAELRLPSTALIAAFPGVPTADAGTMAVNCVALTNVVVSGVPLKVITVVAVKPEPFTVRVKLALPATILFGDSVVIVICGIADITKGILFEPRLPELVTVT